MRKFLKILFVVFGVITLGIALLVFTFLQSMKPDKDKEEAIKSQAEQYLKENFNGNYEVYDALYDNMGNFGFEYAAKAIRENTDFLIYYDDETEKLVDTYIASKWRKELEGEIHPFLSENLGENIDVYAFFNDKIGNDLGIDPNGSSSYKDFDVEATIRLTLPRKKKADDERVFNEFISYLKTNDKLLHGKVVVAYIAENGVILEDDEWWEDF
ncbi:hypothetical protein [Sporosarcina sp. D27]|uniref:hypothetical protein n=1 Tax=Sporosarcina sp. D27 TaxID=1382305 RepID=UPI0004703C33|nr:hypothetical protein [Sporosarcina sp. D27]